MHYVDIHEMLLLQKNKGQGINAIIVILLCNSLNILSVSLWVFLYILINHIRNLIIFCINVDIDKMFLGKNQGLGINTNIVTVFSCIS